MPETAIPKALVVVEHMSWASSTRGSLQSEAQPLKHPAPTPDEGDLEAPRLSLCHFAAVGDDEGIHAQAIGQLRAGVKFDQRL